MCSWWIFFSLNLSFFFCFLKMSQTSYSLYQFFWTRYRYKAIFVVNKIFNWRRKLYVNKYLIYYPKLCQVLIKCCCCVIDFEARCDRQQYFAVWTVSAFSSYFLTLCILNLTAHFTLFFCKLKGCWCFSRTPCLWEYYTWTLVSHDLLSHWYSNGIFPSPVLLHTI